MKKKAFTLIELIAVLVILAILALIVTPLVMNIIKKSKDNANRRSVDNYGRAIELAINAYELDTGKKAKSMDDLKVEYKGSKIKCNVIKIRKNQTVFLSECYVNGNKVEDKKTYDKYYHYGMSDYDYVDAYGKALEKQIENYIALNNTQPDDLDSFENKYSKYVSCDYTINNDNTLFLTKCSFNNNEVKDSHTGDGYYHYGNIKYKVGDMVTYNNIDFYVLSDSGESSNLVTLLKAEPLTMEEITTYSAGTGAQISNQNGYGGMQYHSSNNNYSTSYIKATVDAWKNDKVSAASEARLILLDDLKNDLGYELDNSATVESYIPSESTPTWVYGSNYNYWTMSQYQDSKSYVWRMDHTGNLYNSGNYGYVINNYNVVRPVITISKSNL